MPESNKYCRFTGASMFSSAGLAEQYFSDVGIDIVAANELLPERAELYRAQYPNSKMICGDISDDAVFKAFVDASPEKLDFLIASPPC